MKMINSLLEIEYPIIQGGMANIATAEFAAAVSNAGGLGLIACGSMSAADLKKEIAKCRTLTNKPFGVNVMMMNPEVKEIMALLVEEKVAVVTTGAGNPGAYIPALKAVGTKVIPVVPSVALAIRMERAGADAVVAEGTEAGGHVAEQTTLALIPQVVDAVNIPVIAAGGIGDARGLVAALALGAAGVQMGTRLLATTECPIHANYKQAVIEARDTDTIVTGRSLKAPVRILKNMMARSYVELEAKASSREELEHLTLGGLRKAVFDGDMDNGSVMMGQIAGLVKEIKPVKAVFEEIASEAKVLLEKLGGMRDAF